MLIKYTVISKINGNASIVDAQDEDAPLITFHNEFNTTKVIGTTAAALGDDFAINLACAIHSQIPIDLQNSEIALKEIQDVINTQIQKQAQKLLHFRTL